MNEVEFRNWLIKNRCTAKVAGDHISRIKRVERELNHCDIDEQYRSDKCEYLIRLFSNNGNNEEMKKFQNNTLPIGKYYMSTYRLAIRKYVMFCDDTISKIE
ncbi:MAG: hypothetical protein KH020_03380 [Clostridiales bacterium]|nr:hypothetical protein [Clostridiales bacterium]